MNATATRAVIVSERLGPLGPIERRIEEQTGARVSLEPLWSEEQLIDAGGRADVLVVGAVEPITERVLKGFDRTLLVVRRGIGVDNVDVSAATACGIPVAFVPDASVEEVSDHALALLLALERRLTEASSAVRAGDLPAAATAVSRSRLFRDLTVGVVGLGRIGQATARKLVPLVDRVLAYDPVVPAAEATRLGVEPADLDDLLARSHAVTLHAPLTPATRELLDARRIALLPAGALVVNTARGELLDEDALLAAIRSDRLGGAALDVTRQEPLPSDSALLAEPRIVLTGHTAAKGRLSGRRLREEVARAVVDGLEGRAPRHLADPAVLENDRCRLAATGRR